MLAQLLCGDLGTHAARPTRLFDDLVRMPYACLTRIDERGANLRNKALLGHKSLATTAPTRTLIPSGSARSWETSGGTRNRFFLPMSQGRQKGKALAGPSQILAV